MTFPTFASGEPVPASDMNAIGLWLVQTHSWTNQTTITRDGVFTSDYKNYLILCNAAGGGPQNLGITFRAGGADTGAGLYKFQSQFLTYTAAGWATGSVSAAGNSYAEFLRIQGTEEGSCRFNVMGPRTATRTTFYGECSDNLVYRIGGGIVDANTQIDGFKLTSTNNTSGTVRVYGYRN